MKVAKVLLVVLPTIGFFVLLAGLMNPPKPRLERIKEGCEREFRSLGEDRVLACEMALTARDLEQQDRDRMARAAP